MNCLMIFWSLSVLIMISFACASSSQHKKSNVSRNVITAEEISNAVVSNAYEAIKLLRPHLLNYRGVRGRNIAIEPVVYVNNMRYGGLNSLHNINASTIKEIKYLHPNDATTLFGIGHMGGALVIMLK